MQKTEAIEHFGGAAKLANALGLKSRQAIYAWPEEVPELYQYKLHHLSGGKLPLSPQFEAREGSQ
jgi:hypothetical protein